MSLDVRLIETRPTEIFHWNVTHNLNVMAEEVGLYKILWRPEELGVSRAADLIGPLTNGLALLISDPERFKQFNPKNGWGSYELLVEFVTKYLDACIESPNATVEACR